MEIRGVRESELAEMIDLQCLVFRPDGQARFWGYVRDDPTYTLEQNRVVIVDGRIAATLRVWPRIMRIGAGPVAMGGIGGVCTAPDYRGRGYASALMRDAAAYMQTNGYALGVLFSIIPAQFYRRLGWAGVPLAGFRLALGRPVSRRETSWPVVPFDESRDLEQVVALYQAYNSRQSGSFIRSKAYWDAAPQRLRRILPTVVARRGQTLGGYLNYRVKGKMAVVLEVAYDSGDPGSLVALSNHLLQVGEQQALEGIVGEIPHRHPLVDLLLEGSAGDLQLTGNSAMMLYSLNLAGLFQQLLPELQGRLDEAAREFPSLGLEIAVDGQRCRLHLDGSGRLQLFESDLPAERLRLPHDLFWRLVLGETGWCQLEAVARARGIVASRMLSELLACLFPQREVIVWAPDHY